MAATFPPSAWHSATPDQPCPICGKPDWCSLSSDGTVALCRRVAEGGVRRVDRAGVEYWVHRLAPTPSGVARPAPGPSGGAGPAQRVEATPPEVLDRAYRAAMHALALSDAHRVALVRRGLPDVEVRLRGYRTLSGLPGALAAGAAAQRAVGAALARVPGFRRRPPADGGAPVWVLSAHPGLLIPVRDVPGRIVALKVRRDSADGGLPPGPRYVYASSARWGGPGPGAPAHVPLLPLPPAPIRDPSTVRITEGELKSDIAFLLGGVRTVSVPGVGAWRSALPVLRYLGARRVLLSFDADAGRKPAVARALYALAWALQAESGVEVALEQWDEADGKGIDDLLAAGHRPAVIEGADVPRRLEAMLPGGAREARGIAARAAEERADGVAPMDPERALQTLRALDAYTRRCLADLDHAHRRRTGLVLALRGGVDPGALLGWLLVVHHGDGPEAEARARQDLSRAARVMWRG